MKIAVYSIAKNEEQFVNRWAESARDADARVLVDTGSTDETVPRALECGVTVAHVRVSPWRFDSARDASLAYVPEDIDLCIALDLDEVLRPGWREALETLPAGVSRPRYKYTWSWNADGAPGLVYSGDKIHARHGYRWKHPVHECLVPDGVERQAWCGLEIHHHPDPSKPRSQYAPLLAQAVRESPDDDRMAFYYARELFFAGSLVGAADEFKRHLGLPAAVWPPERAASMRYLAKCLPGEAERWLLRACAECPDRREPWAELAAHYYTRSQWPGCHAAAARALAITDRPLEYLCEAEAWGHAPHDYAAIAAYRLGLHAEAVRHADAALALCPGDARLASNLAFCRAALSSG